MCGKAEPFRLAMLCSGLRPVWPGRSPATAVARSGKSETFHTSGGESAEEMAVEPFCETAPVMRALSLRQLRSIALNLSDCFDYLFHVAPRSQ